MNKEIIVTMLRDWLGIDPEWMIEHVGLRSRLPLALLVVSIIVAVSFAGYLYFRETNLSRRLRIFLTVLRSLVYVAIVVILFEPFFELSRKIAVRRNVLVLMDRSLSMGIADARHRPQDIADAAVALGQIPLLVPEKQEMLALARQSMIESAAALKQERFDESKEARGKAVRLLTVILNDSAGSTVDKRVAGVDPVAGFTAALQDLLQQQKGLRDKVEQLDRDGKLNADRRREIVAAQDAISKGVDGVFVMLRGVQPVVPQNIMAGLAAVPRIVLARGLIDNQQVRPFERLARDFNVRFYTFGEKLTQLDLEPKNLQTLTNVTADAKNTSLGSAIEEAVLKQGGQPVAGVVLLTDGAFNEGVDPLDVARKMKEKGIPMFAVGLGLKAPEDVGVRSLMAPSVIFPKDDVRIRAQVYSQGYPGMKTEVRVLLDGVEMGKTAVELGPEPKFVDIAFKAPEGKSGTAKLSVTIPEQAGEVTAANNVVERSVRIMDQKIKVLFIEGKPRWEYRYLRVILQRDPRLSVKFLMTEGDSALPTASKDYIARYPENPEEAFSYDLVIIGDVASWYFTKPQLEKMVQLVKERGGSILMVAGDNNAPYSYVDTPLADILPVKITGNRETVPERSHPVPTARGKQSLAMFESAEEANNAVWARVQPLFKVPSLKGAKAGANVLVELPQGPNRSEAYPLVSWQYAGTGKAMFIGTDQLWRLRIGKGDEYHARFWGQAIQFLALSRLLGENKRIRLEVDRNELRAGERLEIHANVLNEFFVPVESPEYAVQVERIVSTTNDAAGGKAVAVQMAVKLAAVPGAPGLYQGYCTLTDEGRYSVKPRSEDTEFANSIELVAGRADPEKLEPAMQEDLLRKVADLSGGRYINVREWPSLPGTIAGSEHTVVEHRTKDLWDRWPPYALIVFCLGFEWFLRRSRHLV